MQLDDIRAHAAKLPRLERLRLANSLRELADELSSEDAPEPLVLLLVEDEPATRRPIKAGLESLGWQVHEAQNGAEALGMLGAGLKVSVVLLDVVMPVMGGPETLDMLRTWWPALPVAMWSADPVALSGDSDAKIPKPATFAEVDQGLRRLLRRGRLVV